MNGFLSINANGFGENIFSLTNSQKKKMHGRKKSGNRGRHSMGAQRSIRLQENFESSNFQTEVIYRDGAGLVEK